MKRNSKRKVSLLMTLFLLLSRFPVENGSVPSYGGTPSKQYDDSYHYTFNRWSPTPRRGGLRGNGYNEVHGGVYKQRFRCRDDRSSGYSREPVKPRLRFRLFRPGGRQYLDAGAIGAGLNHCVTLYFKAGQMNFSHCFYGVGVSLSPCLMAALYVIMVVKLKRFAGQLKNRVTMMRPCNTAEVMA